MVRDTQTETIVKSIVNTHARSGASIVNIMSDYIEHTGEPWPMADRSFTEIREYLHSIDGLHAQKIGKGDEVWFLKSGRTQHLKKMIVEQKPARVQFIKQSKRQSDTKSCAGDSDPSYLNTCYYKDNYVYRQKKMYNNRSGMPAMSNRSSNDTVPVALYDHLLLGDDFLMAVATADLGFRYQRANGIRRCGFCISGQFISDAANRIRNIKSFDNINSIIINIGSVDILHGREIIDIRHDFEELIKACVARKLQPIITTLAPIANCGSNPDKKQMVITFNNWLLDRYSKVFKVIDLFVAMASPRGKTLFDCYQPEAVYVSGSSQPHLLWNRIGRQRILKLIKSKI